MLQKKNHKRKWFHKKRNPLKYACRRHQGISSKPFTPFIEVQEEKDNHAV